MGKGKIVCTRVERYIHTALDKEVLRLVKLMPN